MGSRVGGSDSDNGEGVVVDGSGNVYVTGHFISGTADFDPGAGILELTSPGSFDVFVLKLNSSGDLVWARRAGGTDLDLSNELVVRSDELYVTGSFSGTADFDPGIGTLDRTRQVPGTCSSGSWRVVG